ncbi:MAG: DUF4105 domain-containing protein [Dokdonella sp.]|uniref:Lnb N-terminal periplasmic domain-containing protein n=1 Tax=Dokdonella sp. TaxID=2291710 RepID=UPI003264787E
MRRVRQRLHPIALVICSVTLLLASAWGAFALAYQAPGSPVVKGVATGLWIVFSIAMIAGMWRRRVAIALPLFAAAFALLLVWWHHLPASNDRVWADDVAQMTSGTIDGSHVTLHNVRNFDWRSDTDYTQRWETRHYDLDQLESVDMILSYWSGPAIAHMLVSFGFNDGQHVAFSVEIRRERDETFSEIGGFFKEFELSVIAADERDVIRVRTNVRGEDDTLYRVKMPLQAMRELFLAYVNEANRLVTTPRFYNTVTANCTTLVYHMMTGIVGHLPLGYQLLLSGYLPEYVYARGALDQRETLDTLRALGRITGRAKQADASANFSADIRVGIPAL